MLEFLSQEAMIRGNTIFENGGYGVAFHLQEPCGDVDGECEGKVEGSGNEIHDNGEGDVCPSDLQFLMTDEGAATGRNVEAKLNAETAPQLESEGGHSSGRFDTVAFRDE